MDARYFEYLDQYCERTAQGLLNEPLNAVTNVAFVVAVILVLKYAKSRDEKIGGSTGLLLFLLVLIAFGSLAFHTFANRWSEIADVAAIALFLHFYTAVFIRHAVGWKWRIAWIGIPLFFVANQLLTPVWEKVTFLGQSWPGGYMAAWSCLVLMMLYAFIKHVEGRGRLLLATVTFIASVWFRQNDLPYCESWSHGLHFMWHILNAVVLGLIASAAVSFSQEDRVFRSQGRLFK